VTEYRTVQVSHRVIGGVLQKHERESCLQIGLQHRLSDVLEDLRDVLRFDIGIDVPDEDGFDLVGCDFLFDALR